jgi:membrane protein DedA with SNARE-associated domain
VGPVVERLAGRVGVWQVVTARFVYGTRIVSMLFWGLRGTPFAHFALADLAGCVTWALLLGLAGFALSGTAEALLGEVERVEIWLAAALAAVAVLALGLRVASRRLRRA